MLTAEYIDDHINNKSWLPPDNAYQQLSNIIDIILSEAKKHIAADGSISEFSIPCTVAPKIIPDINACVDIGINNWHIAHIG